MALKIRLARGGSKKRPFYSVVVADSRMPRDGRFIEKIGTYDPRLPKDSDSRVQIDGQKAADWIKKGAKPTARVARFLSKITLEGEKAPVYGWTAGNNPQKGEPGDKANERIVEKAEKETARKSATKKLRLPGKLVDCSASNRDGTELFIVEGDSAGGSAKMARDRKTQALLPLRGKILNVLGAASSKLGSNAEINDLTQALGVGLGTRFNVDDLRYDKIIIMTDADVDGAHIASLLMTFFFTQMRPLIDQGHLYLACPPLYRLTQGAKRVYVADDAEKDAMMEKGLGGKGKIDVQRFKGLGEMDAKDLKETTMNPETRTLIRVAIDEDAPGETGDLVERLMGKKPEMRFAYIQENARFVEDVDI